MTKPGPEAWKSSALAKTYIEGVRMGIPLAAEQIDVMLRLVAAKEEPVSSFLDLGCGNGILAASLLNSHPQARGVLVDFSTPMLDAARTALSAHAANLTFAELDYGDPSWTEVIAQHGPFDVVVSGFSIHHQTDVRKRGLYGEIFNLLGVDGLFVNIEHVASANAWVRERFDDYCIDSLFAAHVDGGGRSTREEIAAEFYHRPDKAANILAPVEDQCAWLRQTGFQDVDCYLKILELAVFGGRRAPDSADPKSSPVVLRPIASQDRDWIVEMLKQHWSTTTVVARGRAFQGDELPGFVALVNDERVGLVTHSIEEGECEIVTLNSFRRGLGIGTALVGAVREAIVAKGVKRLWAVTTNDNTGALSFYQKIGFSITAVYPGAFDSARKLKPELPLIGYDGIPLNDEIELELTLST
jgi:SAM-dependent methyltransferase